MMNHIKKALTISNIKQFVLRHKYTLLFILFLLIIAYLQKGRLYGKNVLSVVCVILAICLFAKNRYTQILSILFVIPLAFDAYFAIMYNQSLTVSLVASIMETNMNEATGMLSEAIISASFILLTVIVLLVLSNSELRYNKIPTWFLSSFFAVIFVVALPIHVYLKDKKYKAPDRAYAIPLGLISHIGGYFSHTLVMGNIFTMVEYLNDKITAKQYGLFERIQPSGISLAEESIETPEKLFIVIGESSSRNHYSLYGYERETTPFLNKLRDTDSLIYRNGVSPSCFTREAVPMSLSFACPADLSLFFSQKNIVDLARNAGYETIWISVQEPSIFGETCVGYLASTADVVVYKGEKDCKDLLLIPHLSDLLKSKGKQCFFIHTLGGHAPYDAQITKEETEIFGGKSKTDVYDATVYHTDKFLEKIDSIASHYTSSVIYYYSDHGEIPEKGGHGLKYGGSLQFSIPVLAINRSKTPVDQIINKYIDPESSLINTCNSIYLLSEIMGYTVADSIRQKAVQNTEIVFHSGKQMTLDEVEQMKR